MQEISGPHLDQFKTDLVAHKVTTLIRKKKGHWFLKSVCITEQWSLVEKRGLATSGGLPDTWCKACGGTEWLSLPGGSGEHHTGQKMLQIPLFCCAVEWRQLSSQNTRLARALVWPHRGSLTPKVSSALSVAQSPELILYPVWRGIAPKSASQYHSGSLILCNATKEMLC